MEKEFMLPEKWYVKATKENEQTLKKWRGGDHTGWNEGLVMLYSKMWQSINKVDQCTEITFDQFKRYVLKEVPEDWNIEVNNPEQWCEVCTFLANPKNRSEGFIPDKYPKFIRRVGHRYGCEFNDERDVYGDMLYPIEKSITWEEFQQLKQQEEPKPLPKLWCVQAHSQKEANMLEQIFFPLIARRPFNNNYNSYFHYPEVEPGICTVNRVYSGYTEVPFDLVLSHFSKTTNMSTNNTNNGTSVPSKEAYQNIFRVDLGKIHSIACSGWKTKLENKASLFPFDEYISFSNQEVEEMFKAATSEQLSVVSTYFTRPVEDKNAFIKGSVTPDDIRELSNKIFGNKYLFQLLDEGTPTEELRKRGFWVDPSYEVKIGGGKEFGTYIAIYKK